MSRIDETGNGLSAMHTDRALGLNGSEARCRNWPESASDHVCTLCDPERIRRLNVEEKQRSAMEEIARDAKAKEEGRAAFLRSYSSANAGLDQMAYAGPVRSNYQPEGAHRLFTRQEITTVIRVLRVDADQTERSYLERLCRIFERME